MNAIAAPKSFAQNRFEGFALTAILQGFPAFAATALLLKLARHEIAGGVVLFVVLTSVLHGVFTLWLAPKNFQSSSSTATSRCSSTLACRSPRRSRSGASGRRRRCNW
jgi:hypothetical protein